MFNKIWIQWNLNSIQSNSSWNICGSHQCYNFNQREKKHHHVLYAWWFQMLIKFIPNFFFVVSLFFCTILIFLMIILNSCLFQFTFWVHISSFMNILDSYCFNLLLKTIVSIFYWIDEVSIFFCFNLSLNWCFNSHNHIQLLFQFSHKKYKHNSKTS